MYVQNTSFALEYYDVAYYQRNEKWDERRERKKGAQVRQCAIFVI